MILRGKLPLVGRLKLFSKGLPLTWVTAANLGTFNAGTVVNRSVAINQPATYSLFAGTLPGGLTLSPTGNLTGTLNNNGGVRSFTVRATVGPKHIDRVFSFTVVAGTISITSPSTSILGPVERYATFSQTIVATSSLGRPITYSISQGALPAGLTLTGNTISGTITGDPATYSFTIRATDGVATATSVHYLSVTQPLTKASVARIQSVRYNNSISNNPQYATNADGFTVTLEHAAHALYVNDTNSSLGFNFKEEVVLKHIMPNGNTFPADAPLTLYVEYFSGVWSRAATYSNGVWEYQTPSMATDWRVRAVGAAGRFQVGTLTVVV